MTLDVHPLLDALHEARAGSDAATASTMTLVLFFEEPQIADWVRDRTAAIAQKHPSRVVMFDGTRPAGEQHAETPQARGEWVEVGVKGVDSHGLASALATLALPEAPIVLIWLSTAIAHDERFAYLAPLVQTVLVSSSAITPDSRAMRDFLTFVDEHRNVFVQDISYLRLAAWQELIAEFFDEEQFARELVALEHVEITGGSDAEQYYFLGWLASRLGWTPCAYDQFCNRQGKIVHFTMQREGVPRRISRIVLRSPQVDFHAEIRPEDPDAVCLEVRGALTRPQRCAPLHALDIASLVERGILAKPRESLFEQTMQSVKHITQYRKG